MNAPVRVLDLTDELAQHGARLFVGMGADVLRPLAAVPETETAEYLHWEAGKRLWTTEAMGDDIAALVPDADVVLESGPLGSLRTLTMREADPAAWAHVVHVVVTPFGLSGPRRKWHADDLVTASAGGMTWLGGDPGEAPEAPPREQARHLAGSHAAIAAMLGLLARRRTGRGQLIEVSAQEAVAATLETGAIAWIHGRSVPGRTSGVYGHVAHRVFEGADGFLAGGYSGSNRMWDDLLAWMVEERAAEDLAEPDWQDLGYRWAGRPHVDEVVARFVASREVAEFAGEARRRSLPWAEVAVPARLPENPQLRARDFFVEIARDEDVVTDVGFPFASGGRARPIRLESPRPAAVRPQWRVREESAGPAPKFRAPVSTVAATGALSGIRVLDLTWVLAGPYATKTFADHGAEIVKVESRHRQDPTRFSPGMRLRPGATHDESGYFLNFNRNKSSLALNLRHPDGPKLLRRLVPEVDIVVENFSPGVLAKWSMDYPSLRELNPDIILVSMSGVGHHGPWRQAVTFADTLAAMSGLTSETGLRAGRPQGLTFGLGDMVAANAAVLGALELLYDGRGGHVDLSQLEAMASQLGTAVIEATVPCAEWPETIEPVVIRASGDDRWVAIGRTPVTRLADAVTAVTGKTPDLDDPIATLRPHAAFVDADVLAARLQAHGVAAYPVRDGRDLLEHDEQLAERGFYVSLTHPTAGPVMHEGVVVRMGDTPGGVAAPAPLLGQHTDELLASLSGLTSDELAALHADGVLE